MTSPKSLRHGLLLGYEPTRTIWIALLLLFVRREERKEASSEQRRNSYTIRRPGLRILQYTPCSGSKAPKTKFGGCM